MVRGVYFVLLGTAYSLSSVHLASILSEDKQKQVESLEDYASTLDSVRHFVNRSRLSQGFCHADWVRGPIIVGGMSDCGTRGVAAVLEHDLHVEMTTHDRQPTGDDWAINEAIATWYSILNQTNGHISKSSYEHAALFDEAAQALCTRVKWVWQVNKKPQGVWGFKSPRSILMVPIWDFLFGGDYRFVHVVRDPRAACETDKNRKQYDQACTPLLSAEECRPDPEGCFEYWTRVNGDVWDFYHQGSDATKTWQYAFMSSDRLVDTQLAEAMLAKEIPKLNVPNMPKTMASTIASGEAKYKKFYMANRTITDVMVPHFANFARGRARVATVLKNMGYQAEQYGPVAEYGL